jgi:hypothetical protein
VQIQLPEPYKIRNNTKAFEIFKDKLRQNIEEFANIKENVYNRVIAKVMDEFDLWDVDIKNYGKQSVRQSAFGSNPRSRPNKL